MDKPITHTTGADLDQADPAEVASRALVEWDAAARVYTWTALGRPLRISSNGEIQEHGGFAAAGMSRAFLATLARLYLLGAKDIPRSGHWVLPAQLRGGRAFFSGGSHVLPLGDLAGLCAAHPEFLASLGSRMSGRTLALANQSIELRPFPRLPAALICRAESSGVAGQADLLFDSTAHEQLPLDSLWATALLVLEAVFHRAESGMDE